MISHVFYAIGLTETQQLLPLIDLQSKRIT
jgi:hypothetical protein